MEPQSPQQALRFFLGPAIDYTLTQLGQGKVNDTWLVQLTSGEQYVLQKIPAAVFADPGQVMYNQRLVTTHLRKQTNHTLRFYQLLTNTSGQDTYYDPSGNGWRLLTYLEHSRTLEQLETPNQATSIGAALADFHNLLFNLDSTDLYDPLPNFHNTPVYLDSCRHAMASARIKSRAEHQCMRLVEQLQPVVDRFEQQKNALTRHIIHGDPKVSNFLFCRAGEQVISIIDLDTVKPGLLLHDLGDCCRSCCNRSGEDHLTPEQTTFSSDVFAALLSGYADRGPELLQPADLNLLPMAAELISFELGLRFFTDHLQGDIYFKVNTPGQNLHRALVQFHLAISVEQQQDELQRLVYDIFSK